jgi:hypothetical protein
MLIIKIHNDGTGTKASGNYDVSVLLNTTPLWFGRIENHWRDDGWVKLLELIAQKKRLEEWKEVVKDGER